MSEFGKGLTYCLGMFIAHADQFGRDSIMYETQETFQKSFSNPWASWFFGATDHLIDIQIDSAPNLFNVRQELQEFVDECFRLRNDVRCRSAINEKKVQWAIRKAIELLMKIDFAYGVPVERGEYE